MMMTMMITVTARMATRMMLQHGGWNSFSCYYYYSEQTTASSVPVVVTKVTASTQMQSMLSKMMIWTFPSSTC